MPQKGDKAMPVRLSHLSDRGLLGLSGPDAKTFLQTNSMFKVTRSDAFGEGSTPLASDKHRKVDGLQRPSAIAENPSLN